MHYGAAISRLQPVHVDRLIPTVLPVQARTAAGSPAARSR
jgi:hypothetical protein